MKEELARICQEVGRDIALVQGAGGNISVKSDELMRIKASGLLLSEVTPAHGHVLLDHRRIAAFLDRLPAAMQWSGELEQEYITAMKDARREEHAMPSLETGFHSFLSTAVIHTHPLAVNAYTCSVSGPQALRELFPDAIIIPYATIGVVLSNAVRAAGAKAGDGKPIFLLNHGLIVHDETLDAAYARTQEIVATLTDDLGKRGIPAPSTFRFMRTPEEAHSEATGTLVRAGLLPSLDDHFFPDSAVYCPQGYRAGGVELRKFGGIIAPSRGAAEIAHASAYIALAAERLGGVQYLPREESLRITQMETEKYRQRAGK